jgi:hypothetical protein
MATWYFNWCFYKSVQFINYMQRQNTTESMLLARLLNLSDKETQSRFKLELFGEEFHRITSKTEI